MWTDNLERETEQYWVTGNPTWTKKQIEGCVTFVRLELYNRDMPCGPRAIQRRLEEYHIRPLPSIRTISRMLASNGLTYGRTGFYDT